jgi:small redox-active disulfide protein 2
MEIKVLGTGCPKCKALEKRVMDVLAEMNVAAGVEKVTDIKKIMSHGIIATPGLVINGKVMSTGRIPRPEEIQGWIKDGMKPI